jgi:hypothetical protein
MTCEGLIYQSKWNKIIFNYIFFYEQCNITLLIGNSEVIQIDIIVFSDSVYKDNVINVKRKTMSL